MKSLGDEHVRSGETSWETYRSQTISALSREFQNETLISSTEPAGACQRSKHGWEISTALFGDVWFRLKPAKSCDPPRRWYSIEQEGPMRNSKWENLPRCDCNNNIATLRVTVQTTSMASDKAEGI